jgi:hypothetical protein
MALKYTSATTIIYNNLSNGGIIHRTSGFVQLIANQETDKREGLWETRGLSTGLPATQHLAQP